MRRWVTAVVALALGGGLSAALLIYANPQRETTEVYEAAVNIPAGSLLTLDRLTLIRISAVDAPPLLIRGGDAARLAALRATHDLAAGQLIQSTDISTQAAHADRRLVFLPLKDSPPLVPGSRVDLLVVDGSSNHLSVSPFAIGVEVRAATAGGLVVVVSSNQAPAFVYAANAMHLTAVVADPGSATGNEGAVSSVDQAMAVAGQP